MVEQAKIESEHIGDVPPRDSKAGKLKFYMSRINYLNKGTGNWKKAEKIRVQIGIKDRNGDVSRKKAISLPLGLEKEDFQGLWDMYFEASNLQK